jgi:hypothetical protein
MPRSTSTRARSRSASSGSCSSAARSTPEYTGGEALYHLYFVQKTSWPYPWLRDALSPEALRTLATWFSRGVIATELALALAPLWPFRVVAIGGTAVMLGMVAVSTLNLLSVMACLIGLLLAQRAGSVSSGGGITPSAGL